MTDLPKSTETELAGLADGSLAGERREQALERALGSPELQAELADQRRVVELTAAADVRAPESLHRRVEAMFTPSASELTPSAGEATQARARWGTTLPGPSRGGRKGRRRPATVTRRLGFAAVAALALIAVVIAIGSVGGGSSHPGSSRLSLQAAANLTLSAATGPAPAESGQHRSQLSVAVAGVSFPYWRERFGWRSSGTRSDEVAGRMVRTVFYVNSDGRRVGYAIASGHAPSTSGGTVVRRWGVSYRLLQHDGATVIAWQRGGHLCVMAGRGVSARTLLNLASWGSERPHAA
jgi:hypothetical protein